MKNEKLLEKIGEISEDYIAEANPIAKTKKKRPWVKWGALAACLALAVFTVIKMIPANPVGRAPGLGDLPLLAITEDSGEAMGFEGYTAYDISEIVNNNPWTETAEISTLPVYQNSRAYNENFQVQDIDFDQMRELLLNVASRLGVDVDNLEITDNAPDEKTRAAIKEKFAKTGERVPEGYFSPSTVVIEDNGIKIEVNQQMTAKITFDPAITLPDEYNFTHYATYEQVAAVAEYLKEKYIDFIGMDNPQVNIHGGDYAIFGEDSIEIYGAQQAQGYSIEFYDGSGDITNQIINYNFNRVAFYCDDDGKLFLARVFQPDLSGKVGDYPIITTNEAKELLKNGNYITTVPEELPGLEYVAKVELIYRTGGTEQFFMPYYRFYIELPDMERENGLKTYGAYYVPAVEGEYISNMPVWDGRLY
ncbi:MAG: hypothetical protein ACOX88_06160 [Christensenellales bacterium]|jgi:hypothetical protein